MNQLALMLAAYLALVGQPDNLKPVQQHEWDSFKLASNKTYENDQIESLRRSVYAVNRAKIEQMNAQLENSGASYKLAVNKFTDRTEQEIKRLKGFRPKAGPRVVSSEDEAYIQQLLKEDPLPDEFDWRKVPGRVTEVKDQGDCGSCWAFAATGALEGQEKGKKLHGGKLIELSEQNLVDCVYANVTPKHKGCDGGLPDDAYNYVKSGIDDEQTYPYEATDQKCRFNKPKSVLSDKGYVDLTHDEEKLKRILHDVGPISVGMATLVDFDNYSGGIYKAKCVKPEETIDHGVLLVGYGTNKDDGDFWIVKNSWDIDWGEDGYFRLARGSNDACVASLASLPKF